MSRRGCAGIVVWLACGCFSDPPSQGSAGETGGSSTGEGSTGSAVTTGSSGESAADSTSTGFAESSSTSSTGESDSTSSGEDTGSSTGPSPVCPPGEVQVGALCLAPLVIQDVATRSQPATPTSFDGGPCLSTVCPDGFALGGGFLLDGVLAHGSHRDESMDVWRVCGAEEAEASPNTWQSFAQCALGSGDVVVNTETYAINGNEGLTCFEADCPPGTTLVGGGGRWGPDFVFQGSEPVLDGSQWEVCGSGLGEMAMIEVDAHCAVLSDGFATEVFEEVRGVAPGTSGCARAACSTGLAIAGGVSTGISMTALASHPDGDEWTACGRADGNFNVQVRSRVLCLEN